MLLRALTATEGSYHPVILDRNLLPVLQKPQIVESLQQGIRTKRSFKQTRHPFPAGRADNLPDMEYFAKVEWCQTEEQPSMVHDALSRTTVDRQSDSIVYCIVQVAYITTLQPACSLELLG